MKTPPLILLASVLAIGISGCDRHGGFRGFGGDRKTERTDGDRANGERAGERANGERAGERRGHGLRRECRSELEQYCAASQRGRERVECLQNHRDKLSDACKTAVDERANRRGGGRRRDRDGGGADDND
ncbi:MAG: hypothetical protein JOZ72_19720 [Alphaproteobacteria bacterium]|nr:hypothetical protein [Alphaproteobacteria bacterium]